MIDCPAASLADEAKKLIQISESLDGAITPNPKIERMNETVSRFMEATHERSQFVQAQSGKGALHQIASLRHFVLELEGMAAASDDTRAFQLEAACNRILHSLASFIETTTGAKREDAGADYYLQRTQSPFVLIEEAKTIGGSNV
jgi:hypothetical protein